MEPSGRSKIARLGLDPIYIIIKEIQGNFLKLGLVLPEYISTSITLQRVNIEAIRRFVESFYSNESFTLVAHGVAGINTIGYNLQYIVGSQFGSYNGTIRISSNPQGLEVLLPRDVSELLIEKLSKLLKDQKVKV